MFARVSIELVHQTDCGALRDFNLRARSAVRVFDLLVHAAGRIDEDRCSDTVTIFRGRVRPKDILNWIPNGSGDARRARRTLAASPSGTHGQG